MNLLGNIIPGLGKKAETQEEAGAQAQAEQPSQQTLDALKEINDAQARSMAAPVQQAAAPVVQENTAEIEARIQQKIQETNEFITQKENEAKAAAEQAQKEIEVDKAKLEALQTTTANPVPTNADGSAQSVEQLMQAMSQQEASAPEAKAADETAMSVEDLLKLLGQAEIAETETSSSPQTANNANEPAAFKDLQNLAQTPSDQTSSEQKQQEQQLLENLIPQIIMQQVMAGQQQPTVQPASQPAPTVSTAAPAPLAA